MKSFCLCAALLSSIFIFSCKSKVQKEKKAVIDSSKYFQVTDYIKSDIHEVNQTPYFIYKTEITGSKKDSSAINTASFNQLAAGFLKPDINEDKLKPEYKESIFADQTTNSITFSYTTLNKSLEIQNIDVLMDESGQKVKRIFIRKFFNYPDSSAIEQLTWKPAESFQINRSVTAANGNETMKRITVDWNTKR